MTPLDLKLLEFRVASNYLLKDPHKALKGETILAANITEYEAEVKRLANVYQKAKKKLDTTPSGKAKGMAGYELSKIGLEGQKARMRLEIAKKMREKSITQAKF